MIKHSTLKRSNLYKYITNTNEKTKSIILGLTTQLVYEFDKLDLLDNQLFKQNTKSAAENFKKQLNILLKTYYSKDDAELMHGQAEEINNLCQINEEFMLIAFELANRTREEVDAFTEEHETLLKKYNLKLS